MELKAIKDAEQAVERILQDNAAEAATLKERIELAADDMSKAADDMREASQKADLTAYQKAKAARQNAADVKEMSEARLQEITEAPLISKADYDRAVSAIRAELTEAEGSAKAELIRLSDAMKAVSDGLNAAITKAESIVQAMQRELRRNQDMQVVNGRPIGKPLPIPQSARDTVAWGQAGVNHFQYGATGRA